MAKFTKCLCPKCGRIHKIKLNWTGRGMPRKFCAICKLSQGRGIEVHSIDRR